MTLLDESDCPYFCPLLSDLSDWEEDFHHQIKARINDDVEAPTQSSENWPS